MNYNEIKLSIYESFNNGEIDEMEKDILLEKLEERYNEEDNNEDITLEEALDTISSYLYEATAQAKQVEKLRNEYWKLNDEIKKLEELQSKFRYDGNYKMIQNIRKKIMNKEEKKSNITEKIHKIDPDDYAITSKSIGDGYAKTKALSRKDGIPRSYGTSTAERLAEAKNAVRSNPWRGNSKRTEREPGRYKTTNGLKESVDDLRLDVYESFNNGNITEEEKNMFLEYLNLDNYS